MSGISPTSIIREVKCRPALYNINMKEYKNTAHKQTLWLEVAENLTPAEDWEEYTYEDKKNKIDLIHTKWKNLRDHFYRVLKLKEEEGDGQRPKYKHYDAMEFMRPFVGYKPPLKRKDTKPQSAKLVDESIGNVTDIDMEALLKNDDEEVESANKRPKRITKPTLKATQKQTSAPLNKPIAKEAVIKNFDGLRKTNVPKEAAVPSQIPSFKIRDGDISFCLSIVPNLRKLGDSKKLRAKIDILKVLQKYNDDYEKSRFLKRSVASQKQNNNKNSTQDAEDMEDTDMPEDHLDDLDDSAGGVVNVKNEHYIDPLNDNGNTKTWWT